MTRILLVDDEVDILDMLKALLEQEGFEVVTAADGRAALDAIDGQVPDVLVTDLMMPMMSGEELLAEVKKRPKCSRMACIVTTAGGTKDALKRLGCPFVLKPYDIDQLVRVVRACIAERK